MRYFVNAKTNGTHAVVRVDNQAEIYAACFTAEDADHIARALELYDLVKSPREGVMARLCVAVERLTAQRRKTVETVLDGLSHFARSLEVPHRKPPRPARPENPEAPYLWRKHRNTEL
jgi:hypothetical protein